MTPAQTPDATSISVIVLSYNQETYVAEAVRSVLAQQGAPIEILISDDCSTDTTFAEIEKTVAGYDGPHHVTVRRNDTNMGLVAHINHVVGLSSGEIIIPAYGDDISLPMRVAEIAAAFENGSPLLVHSDAIAIDENGVETPSRYRNADFYRTTDPLETATSMALYLGAAGAWHRSLFDDYGPLIYPNVYDDHVLGFRAALDRRVAFIAKPLLKYREGVGISHQLAQDGNPADAGTLRRKKILSQQAAAFRQRLKDTDTYGLSRSHPIAKKLHRALRQAELRLECYDGVARMFRNNCREPIAALKAALSEGLRMLKHR